ncbi:MAG TPA: hypothetical protein VE476_17325 [Propionibacteriaceae bacterium]|jgi:hypothetical protein|nr:hypothetical protein [Propionibacteriaceae bacterium]
MSTVLHPAGPEPAQTYWMRRVVLIGIAIVVLAAAGALIANGTSSGSAVQANPSPPPVAPMAATGTPTAAPSPTPSAAARASASATPATASPPGTPSASASASVSAAKPTPTAAPKPAACAASALRPTLTGAQRLPVDKRTTFTLSLINGSAQTCTATVNRDNFELRIYSGSDRIWSTKDCATIVKPRTRTLEAEQAMEWKLTWNGRRSRAGCTSRPEIPRPGTYYATAELTGAEPVQLLMMLRG